MHWNLGHRRVCRVYNKMDVLVGSNQLPQHERMDVLLLSHFLARLSLKVTVAEGQHSADDDPLSVFLSLLPGPGPLPEILNLIPKSLDTEENLIRDIYSRFHNNNFTIHSHMTTIGHGVFPLASRLFNHSCVPNAAPRYILTPAKSVVMEVIALRDIDVGEEVRWTSCGWISVDTFCKVCVPYLDPALTQSRHQPFQYTYGFTCECNSCTALRRLGQPPEPPRLQTAITAVNDALCNYVGIYGVLGAELPKPSLAHLPAALHCVLHEPYMEQLSEQFSKAAHEGEYNTAIRSGNTLLALYLLIYPRNYPQIGEFCWPYDHNSSVTGRRD